MSISGAGDIRRFDVVRETRALVATISQFKVWVMSNYIFSSDLCKSSIVCGCVELNTLNQNVVTVVMFAE